jgi:hypothetical protein
MEIGVPDSSLFSPLPLRFEKPVVVYGTSIAQGACASRPGMAWTAILGRKLDTPVINLGFSGNGRLEKELTDFITGIDAGIMVLDCMPNLVNEKNYPRDEIIRRIVQTVKQLRKSRPLVPILLTDHSGYPNGSVNPVRLKDCTYANQSQHEASRRRFLGKSYGSFGDQELRIRMGPGRKCPVAGLP